MILLSVRLLHFYLFSLNVLWITRTLHKQANIEPLTHYVALICTLLAIFILYCRVRALLRNNSYGYTL